MESGSKERRDGGLRKQNEKKSASGYNLISHKGHKDVERVNKDLEQVEALTKGLPNQHLRGEKVVAVDRNDNTREDNNRAERVSKEGVRPGKIGQLSQRDNKENEGLSDLIVGEKKEALNTEGDKIGTKVFVMDIDQQMFKVDSERQPLQILDQNSNLVRAERKGSDQARGRWKRQDRQSVQDRISSQEQNQEHWTGSG